MTKLDKSDFDPPPREESVVLKLTRASAKKKDYGIRMLASKMLITPKQTVEGLLREVVQDETYRKMQRERDWKNLPSYSQLSVPDGLRGHQIGRLNNSQIDKVARIIRGIRSDDRRGTSRLEADEELD